MGINQKSLSPARAVGEDTTEDLGQQKVFEAGGTITANDIIVVNGKSTTSGFATVVAADADSALLAVGDLWIARHGAVAGQTIRCSRQAIIGAIDTSALAQGDALYLSSTPGAYSGTAPTNYPKRMGTVLSVSATKGVVTLAPSSDFGDAAAFSALLLPSVKYRHFCDFDQWQTWVEAETPYVLNAGTDPQAVDAIIVSAERGIARMVTGDDGTTPTMAVNGTQMTFHVPVQADSGGLLIEARVTLSAITNIHAFFGLTDLTTLEEPFAISSKDVVTANADDAVAFVFDTGAATDKWFACAVDSTTVDTGSGATSKAPVAGTYQRLQIGISADGASVVFKIDGATIATLTGDAGVTPNTDLYMTMGGYSLGAASRNIDVDYDYLVHDR